VLHEACESFPSTFVAARGWPGGPAVDGTSYAYVTLASGSSVDAPEVESTSCMPDARSRPNGSYEYVVTRVRACPDGSVHEVLVKAPQLSYERYCGSSPGSFN